MQNKKLWAHPAASPVPAAVTKQMRQRTLIQPPRAGSGAPERPAPGCSRQRGVEQSGGRAAPRAARGRLRGEPGRRTPEPCGEVSASAGGLPAPERRGLSAEQEPLAAPGPPCHRGGGPRAVGSEGKRSTRRAPPSAARAFNWSPWRTTAAGSAGLPYCCSLCAVPSASLRLSRPRVAAAQALRIARVSF